MKIFNRAKITVVWVQILHVKNESREAESAKRFTLSHTYDAENFFENMNK